jgi:hypothetical protein
VIGVTETQVKIFLVENLVLLSERLCYINGAIAETVLVVQTNNEGDALCYRLWNVA